MTTEAKKAAQRARNQRWYAKNKESWKARVRAYQQSHCRELKAARQERRQRNLKLARTQEMERHRRWVQKNPDRRATSIATYRVKQRAPEAVLEDVSLDQLLPFYAEARRRTRETGIQHEVDHIIPLSRGGLHIPSNLQVLTAEANKIKGDR